MTRNIYSIYSDTVDFEKSITDTERKLIEKRILKRKMSGLEPDIDSNGIFVPVKTDSEVISIPREAIAVKDDIFIVLKYDCTLSEVIEGGENIRGLVGQRLALGSRLRENSRIKELIPHGSTFANMLIDCLSTTELSHTVTLMLHSGLIDRALAVNLCTLYGYIRKPVGRVKIEADIEMIGEYAEDEINDRIKEIKGIGIAKKNLTADDFIHAVKKSKTIAESFGNSVSIIETDFSHAVLGELNEIGSEKGFLSDMVEMQMDFESGDIDFEQMLSEITGSRHAENIVHKLNKVRDAVNIKIHMCGLITVTYGIRSSRETVYLAKLIAVGIDINKNLYAAKLNSAYIRNIGENEPSHIINKRDDDMLHSLRLAAVPSIDGMLMVSMYKSEENLKRMYMDWEDYKESVRNV